MAGAVTSSLSQEDAMRFFRPSKIVTILFVALLSVAATGVVAHACPNSEAEAAEDGGD